LKSPRLIISFLLLFGPTLTKAEPLEFKIVAFHQQEADYNLQADLFAPPSKEQTREMVTAALTQASLLSLVPLIGQVKNELLSQSITGKVDFLELSKTAASAAGSSLLKEVQRLKKEQPNLHKILGGPVVDTLYFVPWKKAQDNLFYQAHKISSDPAKEIAQIRLKGGTQAFEQLVSNNITQYFLESTEKTTPVYIAGLKNFLWVDFENKIKLTVRILLGIKPNPDVDPNYLVREQGLEINKIVIPDVKDEFGKRKSDICAALTFTIEIAENSEVPQLHVKFGEFDKYQDGNFLVKLDDQHRHAPRIEGRVIKWQERLGFIALNFSFRNLTFDLSTGSISSVETFLSPGIRINNANHVAFKISHSFIDNTFKTELNNMIEGQKGKLKEKMSETMGKILSFGGLQ